MDWTGLEGTSKGLGITELDIYHLQIIRLSRGLGLSHSGQLPLQTSPASIADVCVQEIAAINNILFSSTVNISNLYWEVDDDTR